MAPTGGDGRRGHGGARLFPALEPGRERVPPDRALVPQELERPGVTLHPLWEAYRRAHGDGEYRCSQFREICRRCGRKLSLSMREVHRAGEKTFIDFSGKTPHLVDPQTETLIPPELFVAPGTSLYTYAEATPSQQLPDFEAGHPRMAQYESRTMVAGQYSKAIGSRKGRSGLSATSLSAPL